MMHLSSFPARVLYLSLTGVTGSRVLPTAPKIALAINRSLCFTSIFYFYSVFTIPVLVFGDQMAITQSEMSKRNDVILHHNDLKCEDNILCVICEEWWSECFQGNRLVRHCDRVGTLLASLFPRQHLMASPHQSHSQGGGRKGERRDALKTDFHQMKAKLGEQTKGILGLYLRMVWMLNTLKLAYLGYMNRA